MTQNHGNSQPPQVSVSGSILIQGHLTAPSSLTVESAPIAPSSPWSKFRRWWKDEKVIAYATLLLALGTIALAVLSRIQITDFREQERRQLRAYIGVILTPLKVNSFVLPNHPSVAFNVRNAGVTPAYDVTYQGESGVEAFPLPTKFGFPLESLSTKPTPITLVPRTTLSELGIDLTANRPLTSDEFKQLETGQIIRAYFWGTVWYRDAFNEPHYTNFCVDYYGTATDIHHDVCDRHNDAD